MTEKARHTPMSLEARIREYIGPILLRHRVESAQTASVEPIPDWVTLLQECLTRIEWVSVETEPPDCSRYAISSLQLTCQDGYHVSMSSWYPKVKRWKNGSGYDITSSVTHWLPLPSPPE